MLQDIISKTWKIIDIWSRLGTTCWVWSWRSSLFNCLKLSVVIVWSHRCRFLVYEFLKCRIKTWKIRKNNTKNNKDNIQRRQFTTSVRQHHYYFIAAALAARIDGIVHPRGKLIGDILSACLQWHKSLRIWNQRQEYKMVLNRTLAVLLSHISGLNTIRRCKRPRHFRNNKFLQNDDDVLVWSKTS